MLVSDDIVSIAQSPRDEADIVLSNVHQAKGLEFPVVLLGSDFQDPRTCPSISESVHYQNYQEGVNLLYVAVSRSKHMLILKPELEYLRTLKEYDPRSQFLSLRISGSILASTLKND